MADDRGVGDARALLVDTPTAVRTLPELLRCVLPPLALVDALPAHPSAFSEDAPSTTVLQGAWWASIQRALLQNTLVTWGPSLKDEGLWDTVLCGWFTPPICAASGHVWLATVQTCSQILAGTAQASGGCALHAITREALTWILQRLCASTRLATNCLDGAGAQPGEAKSDLVWQDCVTQLAALPTRIANVLGDADIAWTNMLPNLSRNVADELASFASAPPRVASMDSMHDSDEATPHSARLQRIAALVTKLTRIGYVESVPPSPQTPCFWSSVLGRVAPHAHPRGFDAAYAQVWRAFFMSLPETARGALFSSLVTTVDRFALEPSGTAWPIAPREQHAAGSEGTMFLSAEAAGITHATYAILALVAAPDVGAAGEGEPRLDLAGCKASRAHIAFTPRMAIAVGMWLCSGDASRVLPALLAIWSDAARCRRASAKQEQALMILLITSLNMSADRAQVAEIARSADFLGGVSAHMDHTDGTIRRLGMLLAELVSAQSKHDGSASLRFPSSVWDGRGDGRELCRVIRAFAFSFAPATLLETPINAHVWRQVLLCGTGEAVGRRETHVSAPSKPRAEPKTRRLPERREAPKQITPRATPLIVPLDEPSGQGAADNAPGHAQSAAQVGFKAYGAEEMRAASSDDDASSCDEGEKDTSKLAQDMAAVHEDPSISKEFEEALKSQGQDQQSADLEQAFAKKRAIPVYIGQLAPLLREHDYDANKVALKHAEPLIRRKTGWGGEIGAFSAACILTRS